MTRRVSAIAGSALFLVLAPGVVAGLIPFLLSQWRLRPALLGVQPLRAVGVVLLLCGGIGLLDSFARFALQGLGTPAPVYPTRHLVISGLYRYARNPMYIGVVSTIFGQALLFGNVTLLQYGTGIWTIFHLFVLGYEEPRLRATFGSEYERYRGAVPRWIPRLTPWQQHPAG